MCEYCKGGLCLLSERSIPLKRVKRICAKPIAYWNKEPVYGCRYLHLSYQKPLRIDGDPIKYPNIAKLRGADFLNYLCSIKGACKRCAETIKKKRFPLCYRHEFLAHKLSYILQEICEVNLGLKFLINTHGPTSPDLRLYLKGDRTLEHVLEGKILNIETLTDKERKWLKTFSEFFSRWTMSELELFTTEHMLTKCSTHSRTIEISTDKIAPFTKLIRRLEGLRRISRWQLITSAIPQNLAEHTCNTILISMILSDVLGTMGVTVDVEKVLRKAAIHDLEEVAMGIDVPTPVKYGKGDLRRFLNEMGGVMFEEMLKEIPKDIQRKYLEIKEEKESIEDGIVEIADKLDALLFALEQVEMGNLHFKTVVGNKISFFVNFKHPVLQPLVKAIVRFLTDVSGNHTPKHD